VKLDDKQYILIRNIERLKILENGIKMTNPWGEKYTRRKEENMWTAAESRR
jgi:hypothetical protein